MLYVIFDFLELIVGLIFTVLIVNAVLSWLIAFDVVDRRNQLVHTLWNFSQRLTEPMLAPIRRIVPPLGGLDLSPLILGLGLLFTVRMARALLLGA